MLKSDTLFSVAKLTFRLKFGKRKNVKIHDKILHVLCLFWMLFLQMAQNEQLQMFDFGPEGNQRKYNQVSLLKTYIWIAAVVLTEVRVFPTFSTLRYSPLWFKIINYCNRRFSHSRLCIPAVWYFKTEYTTNISRQLIYLRENMKANVYILLCSLTVQRCRYEL